MRNVSWLERQACPPLKLENEFSEYMARDAKHLKNERGQAHLSDLTLRFCRLNSVFPTIGFSKVEILHSNLVVSLLESIFPTRSFAA
jgi:hypothetical protein